MRSTFFRCPRFIAGMVLMATGTVILYENLVEAFAHLSHVLGAHGSSAIGVVPAFALAVSVDQQPILQGVLQQLAILSWPLLFVIFGTLLSRDVSPDRSRV